MFGSCVCVKQTGDRRSKLDRHDFTGIFIGYMVSDHNIQYLDMESGLVKSSHHAVFDEAWYMQPQRPPAAQLLYDLGLESEDCMVSEIGPDVLLRYAQYPRSLPMMEAKSKWEVSVRSLQLPLPLQSTALPSPVTAAAARTVLPPVEDVEDGDTLPLQCRRAQVIASEIAGAYNVDNSCIAMVYMSPSHYHDAFDEVMDIRRCDFTKCPTAGMSLLEQNGRLILAHMFPGTPGAKIP